MLFRDTPTGKSFFIYIYIYVWFGICGLRWQFSSKQSDACKQNKWGRLDLAVQLEGDGNDTGPEAECWQQGPSTFPAEVT